jgi:hypothetical protein
MCFRPGDLVFLRGNVTLYRDVPPSRRVCWPDTSQPCLLVALRRDPQGWDWALVTTQGFLGWTRGSHIDLDKLWERS